MKFRLVEDAKRVRVESASLVILLVHYLRTRRHPGHFYHVEREAADGSVLPLAWNHRTMIRCLKAAQRRVDTKP